MSKNKTYLGDGIYIESTLGFLKLTTENGFNTTNTIYLEDEALDNLFDYIKDKFPEYYAQRMKK